jgi:hypothetical protein
VDPLAFPTTPAVGIQAGLNVPLSAVEGTSVTVAQPLQVMLIAAMYPGAVTVPPELVAGNVVRVTVPPTECDAAVTSVIVPF